jgi:stage III sporulation protein AD
VNDVIKICGVAFVGLISVGIMRGVKNDFSVFVSVATGLLLLAFAIGSFYPVIKYVEKISVESTFSVYVQTIFKALGVAVVTETAADICRDFGESAIASKVELAAKGMIMMLALPVVENLLALSFGMIK